jgi:hypothetical protein
MVTAEYSAVAREQVGNCPLLAPYQAVVLERDPDDKARAACAAGGSPRRIWPVAAATG